MKYKTTRKAVLNGYCHVIAIGYCNAQHLLGYVDPIAYTTGVNGWGADIYHFGNVAIATGYAPFGDIKPSYDKIREYDKRAEAISAETGYNYKTGKKATDALLLQFIDDLV